MASLGDGFLDGKGEGLATGAVSLQASRAIWRLLPRALKGQGLTNDGTAILRLLGQGSVRKPLDRSYCDTQVRGAVARGRLRCR